MTYDRDEVDKAAAVAAALKEFYEDHRAIAQEISAQWVARIEQLP